MEDPPLHFPRSFNPPFFFFLSLPGPSAEGSPGCNPPDIRVTKPRRHSQTTTSSPILTFETTQIYLPDDFTTGDLEFINHNKDAIRAAFRNTNTGELLVDDVGIHDDLSLHHVNYSPTYTWNDEKKNFEHTETRRSRRAAITFPSSAPLKLRKDIHGVLTISEATAGDNNHSPEARRRVRRSLAKNDFEVERIYIQSTDLVSSLQQPEKTAADDEDNQIRTTNRTNDDNSRCTGAAASVGGGVPAAAALDGGHHSQSNFEQNASGMVFAQHPDTSAVGEATDQLSSGELRRVKRKSGKTTGALSRPKSDSGSSSSKSTSRKTQCKC